MSFSPRDRVLRGAGWVAAALFIAGSAVAQAPENLVGPEHSTAHRGHTPYLQGDYGFTTANNCVRAVPHPPSILGMDPDTRQLLTAGESVAQAGGGVMHFFRDGRLTVEATASEVNFDKTSAGDIPSATDLDGTCSGTYKLAAGSRVTLFFNCHINIPQQRASFDLGPTEAEGFVSEGARSMNLSQKDHIQTVRLFLPNGAQLVSERVCIQRFSLTRIDSRVNPRGSRQMSDSH